MPLPKEAWNRVTGLAPSMSIFGSEGPAPFPMLHGASTAPPSPVADLRVLCPHRARFMPIAVCLSVVTCVQVRPVFIESLGA